MYDRGYKEMFDISEDRGAHEVTFSANVNSADLWMRESYGQQTITFKMPSGREAALKFREAAKAKGFTVG